LLYQLDAEAKNRGRAMVLQSPTPAVHRVLNVLGIDYLLTIKDAP
jgi:hypothetical protein